MHSALCLVLTFFTAAAIWLLVEAEFLAIVLVLVYVGAVMVLFLFVVMMLDIDIETLRSGFTRHVWLGGVTAAVLVLEIVGVVVARALGANMDMKAGMAPTAPDASNSTELGMALYTTLHLSLRARRRAAAGGHHRRHRADHAPPQGPQGAGHRRPGGHAARRPPAGAEDAVGDARMITLQQMLFLSGALFSIAVAGIFINRKNIILLLMCIELLLLSANFNFVAFSRYLGNIDGQVFVFFVLTVAAAEAAIGLAILVVLFRERKSINVAEISTLKG